MNQVIKKEYHKLHQWLKDAITAGWLDAKELSRLETIETEDAQDLFIAREYRPLIIGFFGGTGVGKSSLLNRLAGQNIARVGIKRPTSHEVSLYLHEEFTLSDLPDELPLDKTQIYYHGSEEYKMLSFIDMPDVDSDEIKNKALVVKWLPYIDYLVYVVTPERYLDAAAWEILQKRSDKHHLIFVMNYYDQATGEQLKNFSEYLQKNDIENPLILQTSCQKPYMADDLPQLAKIIKRALTRHDIKTLQELGLKAALDEIESLKRVYIDFFADDKWQNSRQELNKIITREIDYLSTGLLANKTLILNQIKFTGQGGLKKFISGNNPASYEIDSDKIANNLWQERTNSQLQLIGLKFINFLKDRSLAQKPFSGELKRIEQEFPMTVKQLINEELDNALLKPGNFFSRLFYHLSGFLSWVLPLVALIWVTYHLLVNFYLASKDLAEFLDVNFVSHSLMLIFASWLLPKIIHYKLTPSIKTAIKRGLAYAIANIKHKLNRTYVDLWQNKMIEHQKLKSRLE